MKLKLLIGIIAVTVFAFCLGMGVTAKANFNGTWTLEAGKSEGLPPGMTQTMTVTQTGDRVEVEAKLKVGDGAEQTIKDAYVLDGKEVDFTPPIMGGGAAKKAKRTSRWTADENGFDASEEAVVTNSDGGEDTIRAKRRWRLSADGKALTIEMDLETPNGAAKSKRVFAKK